MATPRSTTVVIPLGDKELTQDFSWYRDLAKQHGIAVINFQAVPRKDNRYYPGQCTVLVEGDEGWCWAFARYLAWHHVWTALDDEDAAHLFFDLLTTEGSEGPMRWYLQDGNADFGIGPFKNPHAAAEHFISLRS